MTDHEQDSEDTTTDPESDVGDHHWAGCHYSDEGGQEWSEEAR
jgi:hypothetical protein